MTLSVFIYLLGALLVITSAIPHDRDIEEKITEYGQNYKVDTPLTKHANENVDAMVDDEDIKDALKNRQNLGWWWDRTGVHNLTDGYIPATYNDIYDYSGYGISTGRPSEKNLYADIDAAWNTLRTRYGVSPENIILYGQSIGTVPTIDLAARYQVGAVILHSPLMSGMRVAFPRTKRTWFFDVFPSIDKVPKVTSPVLVIHGTEDEVIDVSHGVAIYERCPRPVEPLWVEGAGHNDIELFSQYLDRLKKFVSIELLN